MNDPRPIDSVVDKLHRHGSTCKQVGSGKFMAQCPAHPDKTPSLSVSSGIDDQALLHCFAGCSTEDITAVLGMKTSELFPASDSARAIEIARYVYTDELGVPLSETVRYSPKSFSQRKPDGSRSIKGVRRVLYRLPKVIQAVADEVLVHVVEGEKDVHAIEQMGGVGTCCPMGAGKWRDEYSDALCGADVLVIADDDPPGELHAIVVRDSLEGVARSVRTVKTKKGNDAHDHMRAGFGLNDFVEWNPPKDAVLIPTAGTPTNYAQLIRLSDVESEDIDWLWPGYLPLGMVVVIDGDPGLGKSTILTDIAARVTVGGRMPDHSEGVAASDVIMLSVEDDTARVLKPRLEKAGANLLRVSTIQMHDQNGERLLMLDPADIAIIEAKVNETGARVVTIDPLMAYLPDGVDSYKDQSIRKVMSLLASLAVRLQVLIIVVRHLTKNGEGNAMYRGGGSIGIIGAARAAYLLAPDPQDPDKRVLAPTKMNIAEKPSSMSFQIVSDSPNEFPTVQWLGNSPVTAEHLVVNEKKKLSKMNLAVEFLRRELADGPRDASELAELAEADDISETTLKRAKAKLRIGVTKRPGFGKEGGWLWFLPIMVNDDLPVLTSFEQPTSESQNNDPPDPPTPQRESKPETQDSWSPLTPTTNHYADERGA